MFAVNVGGEYAGNASTHNSGCVGNAWVKAIPHTLRGGGWLTH